jgi:ATP-binding cassette subfamily F protein 3
MAPTTILTVNDLAKTYVTDEIFKNVTFQVNEREHVAVVGVNGAGKSTLLRIIGGIEHASKGEVVFASGLRVTYLPQEARFDSDRTIREEATMAFAPVLDAAARMREIEAAMATAGDAELEALLEEYDRLQHRFEAAGGYDIDYRVGAVLTGLGFTLEQREWRVNHLSGGQKTRVALAKALLADPDLLLLDEPTNHLDLEMLEWLETFLRSWNGACLVVSHDRYFLDRVTNRTLEVAFGRLEDYPAPYSRYLDLRVERYARRMKEYEEQQAFISRTEEFIRKYKAGQRAREAKGRQTRLDRVERLERPQQQAELNMRLQAAVRSGRTVLSTIPMEVGYITTADDGTKQPHTLMRSPIMTIERGDRVGLVGPNGAGKSTYLKTLIGQIPAIKGRSEFGTNVKVGYYAQGHEQLPRTGTALSVILDAQPMSEEAARNYLGRFLFSEDDVFKRIDSLSGGERSRLALSILMLKQANFLILDEPTNHLDISSRETLEEMLADFDGTILFVSHDRYFIDRIATRIWAIDEGSVKTYLGNYTDYQRALGHRPELGKLKDAEKPKEPEKVEQPAAPATVLVDDRKGREGRPRPVNDAKLQKSLATAERDIARLEGKLNELSDAMTVAGIDGDVDAVARLGAEYEKTQGELDEVYARWEELGAQLDALAAAGGGA